MRERNAINVIKIFLNSTVFPWNFIIQTMSDEAVGPFYTHKCGPSQWAFGPVFWRNFGELQFQLTWLLQQESSKTHQQVHLWLYLSVSFPWYVPHLWFSMPEYVRPLGIFLHHITLKSILVYTFKILKCFTVLYKRFSCVSCLLQYEMPYQDDR